MAFCWSDVAAASVGEAEGAGGASAAFCATARVVSNNNVNAYLILFIHLDATTALAAAFNLSHQNSSAIHVENLPGDKAR